MKSIKRKANERGQDLVEFAITVPFLLLIVFGIFDLGRGAYSYTVLQNSAREGARYGIVHPGDDAGIEARVREHAAGLIQADLTVLTPSWTDDTVQVITQFEYTPVTPFIGLLLGGTVTLESSSTMLREKW